MKLNGVSRKVIEAAQRLHRRRIGLDQEGERPMPDRLGDIIPEVMASIPDGQPIDETMRSSPRGRTPD